MAAFFLLTGIGFRTGFWPPRRRRAKWFHTWYRNEDLPRYQREGGGALLPMGIAWALCTFGFTGVGPKALELTLLFTGLAFIAVSIVFIFWHPHWTKPRWLLEAERRERSGEPLEDLPMPPEGRTMTVSKREYRLAWVLCAAVVVVGITLGQTRGVVIGLAVALPILFAMKVRDSRRKAST